jgi:protein-L-isoaspartate(D-aspartate) O-methyltransferase
MVHAKLIHALQIDPQDRVLEVGAGTGYGSAILARLTGTVIALEEDAALADEAQRTLAALNVAGGTVRRGALSAGAPADGPYDAALFNGAIEQLPECFASQLKEGGRLVCILRRGPAGQAILYRAVGGELSGRTLFDASAPLLPGFVSPPAFVF